MEKPTYHASIWVFCAIGESRSQCGRAALIIVSILAGVDGGIDRNCPHGSGISIAIAVIIFASVTTSPHIDVAKPFSALNRSNRVLWVCALKSSMLMHFRSFLSHQNHAIQLPKIAPWLRPLPLIISGTGFDTRESNLLWGANYVQTFNHTFSLKPWAFIVQK